MICRPPVAGITILFRKRVVGLIAQMLNCGVGFRMFGGKLQTFLCLLTCQGTTSSNVVSCGASRVKARDPDLLAKSTVVTNTGTFDATLYEDGIIVGIVKAGTSQSFPLTGKLEIRAISPTGNTTLKFWTEHRCVCGHPIKYYNSTFEPIGGVII